MSLAVHTETEGYQYPQLLKHENLSFRVLLEKDREAALQILSQEFRDQQPLSNAFCTQFSQWMPLRQATWRNFWLLYIDDAVTNGMSIALFETDSNKMIGIGIVKDLNKEAPKFKESLIDSQNLITPLMVLQEEMIKQTKPDYQSLLEVNGCVLSILGWALRKQYMGRQLIPKVAQLAQKLGKEKGFKYAFVYASNFRSSRSCLKTGYEMIAAYECKNFEYKGVKPFALIQGLHHETTLWLKKIV